MHEHSEVTELKVKGMHCVNCSMSIQRYLESLGLKRVLVDFGEGRVRFLANSSLELTQIISGIETLGYKVEKREVAAAETDAWRSPLALKFYLSALLTIPLLAHMLLPIPLLQHAAFQLIVSLPVFLIGFSHFGPSAFSSLQRRDPNMDVLILLGFSSALIYSLAGLLIGLGHDYLFFETGASIICFVLLGNLLEQHSLKRTTGAVRELQKIQPATAKQITISAGQESIKEIPYQDISLGDILLVNSGDRVPADGVVTWGAGSVDESMVTGESLPLEKEVGAQVLGGTLVVNGPLKMEARGVGSKTLLARIIQLVESAQAEKPAIQKLGDKISAVFVPAVLLVAFLTLAVSLFLLDTGIQEAFLRSIAVLVISCPCAMGLATPTAVIVGVGRAARSGILMRGGRTLESLANTTVIVFDKTGVLSSGDFKVKKITAHEGKEADIISIITAIERHSSHPIARSIQKQFKGATPAELRALKEERGIGMGAEDSQGNNYKLGSYAIAKQLTRDSSHSLYLTKNGKLLATLDLEDELKEGAAATVKTLKSLGIRTVLLSGDRQAACEQAAKILQVDEFHAEKLPHEKLEIIKDIQTKEIVAFVGDGVNDAPALALAATGIAVGQASEAALESAEVVLLSGKPPLLLEALQLSRETLRTIKQNLFWAFFYNILAIPVAAAGYLNPMIAALVMAFSDVIVIGNSLRLRSRRFSEL